MMKIKKYIPFLLLLFVNIPFIKASESAEGKMRIYVDFSGDRPSIKTLLLANATVGDLKEEIHRQIQVSPSNQKLMHLDSRGDLTSKNHLKLSDISIKNNSRVRISIASWNIEQPPYGPIPNPPPNVGGAPPGEHIPPKFGWWLACLLCLAVVTAIVVIAINKKPQRKKRIMSPAGDAEGVKTKPTLQTPSS